MVSGIGQAAKMPQYVNSSFFNGLHGRALPVATAIKAVAPDLTVIAEGGDGDMYGEGGNHFLHACRRNPDMTHLRAREHDLRAYERPGRPDYAAGHADARPGLRRHRRAD
jgi:thiamine pyrophosphate-dependent acetolactate synthase large subunit-like protein